MSTPSIPAGLTNFTWSDGTNTVLMPLMNGKYYLNVGTTQYGHDIYNPGVFGGTNNTSALVTLPGSTLIYVTLVSREGVKINIEEYQFNTL
jgi:hypothetical protein